MKTWRQFLLSKTKAELVELIEGNNNEPPINLKSQTIPKFTKQQILWAMMKFHTDVDIAENELDAWIAQLKGKYWEDFYMYDYLRFDIRKPSIYAFVWVVITSMLFTGGLVVSLLKHIGWI